MPDPLYQTTGGFETNAIYSGQVVPLTAFSGNGVQIIGSDVMLQSGPGRLHAVVPHQAVLALSGVQLTVYDAHAPVSGGPIFASGHIPLGGLSAGFGVSGQILASMTPIVFPGGIPFTSGLCLNSRSGQPGCTFVWTSEPSLVKRQ